MQSDVLATKVSLVSPGGDLRAAMTFFVEA
jgi:hypothetical protein